MAASVVEGVFETSGPVLVPDHRMTPVPLEVRSGHAAGVSADGDVLRFGTIGWFEVLLEVDWSTTSTAGTRFAHSKIPGQQPLHSEAIDAAVLSEISGGKQLLRGNTIFGHDHTNELILELWQNSGEALTVTSAKLVVRELIVPWTG